jgi:hypothetical protein
VRTLGSVGRGEGVRTLGRGKGARTLGSVGRGKGVRTLGSVGTGKGVRTLGFVGRGERLGSVVVETGLFRDHYTLTYQWSFRLLIHFPAAL